MTNDDSKVDQAMIKSIIENRLLQVPAGLKSRFPPVLNRIRVSWVTLSEPEYLVVVFLNEEEEKRITECISKNINPFIGLITTGSQGAAFRIEKAKYTNIKSCSVSNSFAFSLGTDSTIILEDFRQSIETRELGMFSYNIPLAYIISYGEEINKATIYEYFDGLVAYSTNMWREAHA